MNHASIITPTGDRYECILNLSQFLLNQTISGSFIEWIIVDDGETNATARAVSEINESEMANHGFAMFYLRRKHCKQEQGPPSLARNVLQGLSVASATKILIMEDDDCYHSWYLEDMLDRMNRSHAVGTIWQKYYHLPSMTYKIMRNRGSALCSTGLRSGLVPLLEEACQAGLRGRKGIDAKFWELAALNNYKLDIFEPENDAVIGMKGLPGRLGIGLGHRPRGFQSDPNGRVLSEWCRGYTDLYLKIREGMVL